MANYYASAPILPQQPISNNEELNRAWSPQNLHQQLEVRNDEELNRAWGPNLQPQARARNDEELNNGAAAFLQQMKEPHNVLLLGIFLGVMAQLIFWLAVWR